MTKDCSLNYKFSTWKFQAQNMGRTCCVHKLFWMSKQKRKAICVHNMFSPCSELGIFMYWTCNSMNNLSSYCGLVDAKIRALRLMCGSSRIRNVLIGVKYRNCRWTLDVYLLFAIWMGQIQSKLIYIFVSYWLASL